MTFGRHWYVLGADLLRGITATAQAFAPVGFHSKVIGALRLMIAESPCKKTPLYERGFYFLQRF